MKRQAESEIENKGKKQKITHLVDKKLEYLNADKSSWILTWKLEPEARLNPLTEFEELWESHPTHRSTIRIFGKEVQIPRWSQCYGKNYFYSGVTHKAIPFTPILQRYLDYANTLRQCNFNMCVVNWYQNGNDWIAAHADDEPQIYRDEKGNTKILSISFGEERAFWLNPIDKKDKNCYQKKLMLGDGDVLLMMGHTQSTHKHMVPKVFTNKSNEVGRRISLTFRQFI